MIPKSRGFSASLFSISLPLVLLACASPRMVPPPDIEPGAKVLEVGKRSRATGLFANEGFKVGPYQVAKVKRDWKKSTSGQVANLKGTYTTTGYQYILQKESQTFSGECDASLLEKSVQILGGELGDARNKLSCTCREGQAYAMAELQGTEMDALSGQAKTPAATYQVTPANKTNPKTLFMGPVGFRLDGTDGAMGAVETLHPGRIWLTPKMPVQEEMGLVCLMAGFMLYQEPGD